MIASVHNTDGRVIKAVVGVIEVDVGVIDVDVGVIDVDVGVIEVDGRVVEVIEGDDVTVVVTNGDTPCSFTCKHGKQ